MSCTGERVRPGEQPAVLEEDVHELPQHVVGGLGQLLRDERVVGRRHEHPLGVDAARRRRSGSPPAARRHRRLDLRARRRTPSRCRRAGRAARRRATSTPSAGSARLPTMTGWTNSTATWRTSERSASVPPNATSRPPRAKRSAIRWHSAREALGLRGEEPLARLRPRRDERLEASGGRSGGALTRPPPPASGSRASQSRSCVDALARARADEHASRRPGAPTRGGTGSGRGRSRRARAGRAC